jgi:hypothetical protein
LLRLFDFSSFSFLGSFRCREFLNQFNYCPQFPVGRATTTARFTYGNLAITEQCNYFEKCGPMFFDPAVYLIFKFHPDLIITDPAAFTNALNSAGFFMLDRALALQLNGPWAASGEDSS